LAQCQFKSDWMEYHVYLQHGTSMCLHIKTW